MYAEFARVSTLRDFLRVFGFNKEIITLSNTRLAVPTYKKLTLIDPILCLLVNVVKAAFAKHLWDKFDCDKMRLWRLSKV